MTRPDVAQMDALPELGGNVPKGLRHTVRRLPRDLPEPAALAVLGVRRKVQEPVRRRLNTSSSRRRGSNLWRGSGELERHDRLAAEGVRVHGLPP